MLTDSIPGIIVFSLGVQCIVVTLLTFILFKNLYSWKTSLKKLQVALSDIRNDVEQMRVRLNAQSIQWANSENDGEFCLGRIEYYNEQDRLLGKSDTVIHEKDESHG